MPRVSFIWGFDPQLQRGGSDQDSPAVGRRAGPECGTSPGGANGQPPAPSELVPIFEGRRGGDPYLVFGTFREPPWQPFSEPAARCLRHGGDPAAGSARRSNTPTPRALSIATSSPPISFLDEDGTPRVMDFGLAIRIAADTGAGDDYSGTPAYMAPEYVASAW